MVINSGCSGGLNRAQNLRVSSPEMNNNKILYVWGS